MNTNWNHGSAKIYQFPVGGRAALGGHRGEEKPIERTPYASEALCSDSWYHEEAIRQSTPSFKPFWER
jgi:hypothetical protein